MSYRKSLTLRLPTALYERIALYARAEQRSINQAIVLLLEDALERKEADV